MIEHATQAPGQAVRLHGWRLTIAALATPLAWFAQMFLGEMLTAQACSLSTPVQPSAPPAWMMPALLALSGACFVLGVAGLIVAWRMVIFTRTLHGEARERRARRVTGLEWFLARVSVLSSAMFMFGLIATDLAVLVVSPCGRW